MKSLLKIIRRYSLTAGFIIFIILASNIGVFLYLGSSTMKDNEKMVYGRGMMEQISHELTIQGKRIELSEKGRKLIKDTDFVWAMALDESGNTVWEWNLPKEIPKTYTLQDVAAFSRWYLKDYPVRVWKNGNFLLVFGCDKEQVVRYDALMSSVLFKNLPMYLKTMVVANVMIIILFILCYGFRFYRSMKPIAQGIENLSDGKPVDLEEKGLSSELAEKLNFTSRTLRKQEEQLARRDQARTDWISGVSHDIRTPLSLIVGYSDKLAQDESLQEENRRLAKTIRRQSLIIRQLVTDLNLTSKLAYQAQPLKKKTCSPAALLRECIADFYNGEFGEDPYLELSDMEEDMLNYTIEFHMTEDAQRIKIEADEGLIKRALRNLIGNSIRHNPNGCHIRVTMSVQNEKICWLIEDSGPGISEIVVQNMDKQETKVHIMGLRLAAQIAKAHGGELQFVSRKSRNYDIAFSIHLDQSSKDWL
ncbi:MAG: HAMP domain-containing sensor histidine kinase [Lachnospiraceae bacterium]|nr:HAMP domain-containing sensor histidine kinase [Lachnospiraceae bacterium]